jgi:hypothetical protein
MGNALDPASSLQALIRKVCIAAFTNPTSKTHTVAAVSASTAAGPVYARRKLHADFQHGLRHAQWHSLRVAS